MRSENESVGPCPSVFNENSFPARGFEALATDFSNLHIQCRCGAGTCVIRTSSTSNPDRQFFSCPAKFKCGYFRWCDEVKKDEAIDTQRASIQPEKKPYPDWVDHAPLPPNFGNPSFASFNGTGNPEQHLAHFSSRCGPMLVFPKQVEAAKLRCFVQTLEGPAFLWYNNLAPGSINSWEDLRQQFLCQFFSTLRRTSITDLIKCKQRKNERVADFIARWRNLTYYLDFQLPQELLLEMCVQNVHAELLLNLICLKYPGGFREFAERAQRLEDAIQQIR